MAELQQLERVNSRTPRPIPIQRASYNYEQVPPAPTTFLTRAAHLGSNNTQAPQHRDFAGNTNAMDANVAPAAASRDVEGQNDNNLPKGGTKSFFACLFLAEAALISMVVALTLYASTNKPGKHHGELVWLIISAVILFLFGAFAITFYTRRRFRLAVLEAVYEAQRRQQRRNSTIAPVLPHLTLHTTRTLSLSSLNFPRNSSATRISTSAPPVYEDRGRRPSKLQVEAPARPPSPYGPFVGTNRSVSPHHSPAETRSGLGAVPSHVESKRAASPRPFLNGSQYDRAGTPNRNVEATTESFSGKSHEHMTPLSLPRMDSDFWNALDRQQQASDTEGSEAPPLDGASSEHIPLRKISYKKSFERGHFSSNRPPSLQSSPKAEGSKDAASVKSDSFSRSQSLKSMSMSEYEREVVPDLPARIVRMSRPNSVPPQMFSNAADMRYMSSQRSSSCMPKLHTSYYLRRPVERDRASPMPRGILKLGGERRSRPKSRRVTIEEYRRSSRSPYETRTPEEEAFVGRAK
ncbi:hypothetical protein NA57DRAFT_57852 [Rhizodiscina lignyota]|uniref:Uncharacterized protein n=1 Tax=Rhizodiscina lignyota TaxID=1504668 RepID=A0A9P4M4X0_9PEZI|nr:hypothetical protein NA57DRAFT_57852 [Rhizodiscina lignyota]